MEGLVGLTKNLGFYPIIGLIIGNHRRAFSGKEVSYQ